MLPVGHTSAFPPMKIGGPIEAFRVYAACQRAAYNFRR